MPLFAASAPATLPSHTTTVVRADVKTGRLIRAVAVTPQSPPQPQTQPAATTDLDQTISRIAAEHGVEVPLVRSVIRTESNFNPVAVSPKGAMGIMQLIPSTARRFGVSDPFNVAENISGGVRYLRFLLDYYNGDYVKAIAAYNAGEQAVDKYKGIPPYRETVNYLTSVARNLKAERAKPEPARAATPAEKLPADTVIASTGADGRIYYRTP